MLFILEITYLLIHFKTKIITFVCRLSVFKCIFVEDLFNKRF